MTEDRTALGDQAEDVLERAVSLHQRALRLQAWNRRVEAESAARQSLLLFETSAGARDPDVANLATLLAGIRASFDDLAEAEALFRRALAIMDAYPCADEALARLRVQSLGGLGHVLRRLGSHDEAEVHVLAAVTMARSRLGRDDADTLVVENELGILYQSVGRFEQAEAVFREVLALVQAACGDGGAPMATVLHNLAGLEHTRGRLAAAERCARRSVELRATVLGPGDLETVADGAQLGAILADQGKHVEAEELLRAALDRFERSLGPDHYSVAVNAGNLAVLRSERGDAIEAEGLYRRALAIKSKVLGSDNVEVATLANNLAVLLAADGRVKEAIAFLAPALAVLEAQLGPDDRAAGACAANLADLLEHRTWDGSSTDGLPWRRALEERRGAAGPGTDGGVGGLALHRPGNEDAPGSAEPAGDGARPCGLGRQARRLPLG